MRLLLDTHICLWVATDDRKLSKAAKSLMLGASEIYVSSASVWEIAIKNNLGKLKLDIEFSKLVDVFWQSGFLELPVVAKHAAEVYSLPNLHKDPFDRLLIAQAMTEPMKFLTADAKLKKYSDLVELV